MNEPQISAASGNQTFTYKNARPLDQEAPKRGRAKSSKDYMYLLGERSAVVWADAFIEVNPGVIDRDVMISWFANAIEVGAMLEAKKITTRQRHERHIQSTIDGWKKSELDNKLRFKSTVREAEERLVKQLLDSIRDLSE